MASISVICVTVKKLKESSPNISFDYWSMITHSLLLVFQVIAVASYVAPKGWFKHPRVYSSMAGVVVIVDFFVQMLILYICWTQGSSSKLKEYNLTMVPDSNGRMRIQFTRRGSYILVDEQEIENEVNFDNVGSASGTNP